MELEKFPDYYQRYSWNRKHKLYGYAADLYPTFSWIHSLESRFAWLRNNAELEKTASRYLIREMIQWGASQNGVLQKFDDGSGEVDLFKLVCNIIVNLNDAESAIASALLMPGLGLTYASKLLRFMKPDSFGALDSKIRGALIEENLLPRIYDGNLNSMVKGYLKFIDLLNRLKIQLEEQGIRKPDCVLSDTGVWKPAEIEMALFRWVEER